MPHSVRLVQYGWPVAGACAYEYLPATRHHRGKISGRIGLVTRHPANGGGIVLVGIGVVAGGAKIHQMVAVHHIEQVEIPVAEKVGVKGKTQQPEIAPPPDFFADVQQRCGLFYAIVHHPYFAGVFPNVHSAIGVPSEAHHFVPAIQIHLIRKSGRLGF